jgi:hypothetical protein
MVLSKEVSAMVLSKEVSAIFFSGTFKKYPNWGV